MKRNFRETKGLNFENKMGLFLVESHFQAISFALQTLSWGSLSLGGLIGSVVSGPAVHSFGPRGSFLLISIAPLLLLVAAWALPEKRLPKGLDKAKLGDMVKTLKLFRQTLTNSVIWRPALYVYLSRVSCAALSSHDS